MGWSCPKCQSTSVKRERSVAVSAKTMLLGGLAWASHKPEKVLKALFSEKGEAFVCQKCRADLAECPNCENLNIHSSFCTCRVCGTEFFA